MRTLPVVFSQRATQDLTRAYHYLHAQGASSTTARRYLGRVEARCLSIGTVPLGGSDRSIVLRKTRSVPFERSALIFYRVEPARVLITRIYFHGQDHPR